MVSDSYPSERLGKIKKVIATRPWVYSFVGIFILYLIINVIVNQTYVTAPFILGYKLSIVIPFLFFTILVALLVGVNVNLIIFKCKEIRALNKEGGMTFLGLFGGLLGGACPSCFVGLFPAVAGLFGITASLSSLPLYGLEIQIGSALLLVIGTILLTRSNACKVKK